jgi:nitroimidazol reductase NimA-like FMN-containing flavoprotein (pyridoxamine 5'-phosphate oxidase superfamily)
MSQDELNDLARTVVDANSYMALGTADEAGRPWVSPVWFASEDYRHFYWVSSPETRHSRNIEARPEVAIAIFDSSVPVGGAQAVYVFGQAEELTGAEMERGIELFSRASEAGGARRWTLEEVTDPADLRLFRATAEEQFVLVEGDRRESVTL